MREMRREPPKPSDEDTKTVNGHLTHPITDLYNEITNDKATWTDAGFWFTLGLLIDFGKDTLLWWLTQ